MNLKVCVRILLCRSQIDAFYFVENYDSIIPSLQPSPRFLNRKYFLQLTAESERYVHFDVFNLKPRTTRPYLALGSLPPF
jgi:hypothetical protein